MAKDKPVEETVASSAEDQAKVDEAKVDKATEAEKVSETIEPDIVKSKGVPPTIVECGGQDHIKAWELGNGGVLAALEGHGMCFIPGATIQNSPAGPQIVV